MTANWIAVDTAIPITDPNIRSKFLVEVATARSCGFERACNATRAVHCKQEAIRMEPIHTWLEDETGSCTFYDQRYDI
jgi:hypothetical protein